MAEPETVTLDRWTILTVATLTLKLATLRADGGAYERLASGWAAVVRTAAVTLACHGAVLVLLLALLALAPVRCRARRLLALGVHVALLAVAYLDFIYARFQGLYLTYVQFAMVGEGFDAVSTLGSYTYGADRALLVDLPLLLYGALLAPCGAGLEWPRSRVRRAAAGAGLACAAAVLFLAVARGSPDVLARPYNRSYSSPVLWATNLVLYALPRSHYALPEALPAGLPEPRAGPPDGARPDLLLVQVESLQGGALEWEHQGTAVMPYLRSLAATGVYFYNALSTRRGGHSFDADIGVLSGFHPPPSSDPYAYGLRNGPYFPGLLARAGWHTLTFDNCPPEFFRNLANHGALGIESFHTFQDRPWSSVLRRVSVRLPGDREFLGWVRERLEAEREPWFCLVKTISSHGPWEGFTAEEEVRRVIGEPFRGQAPLTGYAAACRYEDEALRGLLDPLLPRIRAGRLMVAVYGDHGAVLDLPRAPVPGLDAPTTQRLSVPLVLLGVAAPAGRRDDVASLHDLPCTLARALGLPFTRGDFAGRDLLSARPLRPLVTPGRVFADGTVRQADDAERDLLLWGYGKLGAPR